MLKNENRFFFQWIKALANNLNEFHKHVVLQYLKGVNMTFQWSDPNMILDVPHGMMIQSALPWGQSVMVGRILDRHKSL
jgi:hypothetical protein